MASSKKKNKPNEDNPQQSFDLDAPVDESVDVNENDQQEIAPIADDKTEDTKHNFEVNSELSEPVDIDYEPILESASDSESSETPPSLDDELSNKETREIVTPYAFTVSPDLLGQPLATPTRRGVAILIDLFLISVLSSLSSLVFAGFVALTFFKAGDRLKQQKRFNTTRLALRGSAAFLIFFIVFSIVSNLGDDNKVETAYSASEQQAKNKQEMKSLLDLAAYLVDVKCDVNDSECQLNYAEGLAIGAAAMQAPIEDVKATTSDLVAQKEWPEETKSLFLRQFEATLEEEKNAYTDDVLEIKQAQQTEQEKVSSVYSIIEWTKGLMSDLGIGLGWAALYFSVFTAWWRGQTLGKKLVGIEVVKLDGNYPSLWESFGRYGGYGAGFATGLLGFLQVYWDPNRQAIQDKISETLVLRLGRKN